MLSVLDPSFRPPRTERVSGGLTRALGRGAAFDISATYRRTDFLPGRTDLNLIANPLGSDQNGLPLFGALTQVGALLTAVPGTSRRFAAYDAVWALQSNASSDYWGATSGIHGVDVGPLQLMASYTHSSAHDNWPSAWTLPYGAWAPGLPVGAQGPADYDVPDRRYRPNLPDHLLAASVAGAQRGGSREIEAAAEARAKLAAFTKKFLIDQ